MSLDSLQKLLVEELSDLYSAEKQITEALPKMVEAASSKDLRKAFESHLKQTERHLERLDKVFEALGERPSGKSCKAMEGIIAEGKEILKGDAEDAVRDAALIAAAQRVEHYEMAGYGTARTFAKQLGHKAEAELLQTTLDEEGATDEKLTRLAEGHINEDAAQ